MIPAHNLADDADRVEFPELTRDAAYTAEFHDGTVRLYLHRGEFDFHLDRHPRALTSVYKGYLDHAHRLGFMPEDADECPPELLEDGFVREWLVPIEPISDVRFEMPSLIATGFGPYSMEMPVVDIAYAEVLPDPEEVDVYTMTTVVASTGEMVAIAANAATASVQTIERPAVGLPPLPYAPPPHVQASESHEYEITWTGAKRRVGRHRKK